VPNLLKLKKNIFLSNFLLKSQKYKRRIVAFLWLLLYLIKVIFILKSTAYISIASLILPPRPNPRPTSIVHIKYPLTSTSSKNY